MILLPSTESSPISRTTADAARSFDCSMLGLEVVMDLGWIITLSGLSMVARPQVSLATNDGSGTAVTDGSVEVDKLYEVLKRIKYFGLELEYGPIEAPI